MTDDHEQPTPDVLLRQLQQHLTQNPLINTNDQIQTLRQQVLLQQLQQSSSAPGNTPLPTELLTKLLMQVHSQQTQIDQMKTIIEQMRTIIENQQQIIQGYQEHNNRNKETIIPSFKQITMNDLNGIFQTRPPSSGEHMFVNETHVDLNSFQQLNSERKQTLAKPRKKRKRTSEEQMGEEHAESIGHDINEKQVNDNEEQECTEDKGANGKTLIYRGPPRRKNMKKTEFKVSKWTLK
jgi:hypothetical protein